MRRCGRDVLHDPHGDCDGRTANEARIGMLTVAELRAALDGAQDWALVAVDDVGAMGPLELIPGRDNTGPVFVLRRWREPPPPPT